MRGCVSYLGRNCGEYGTTKIGLKNAGVYHAAFLTKLQELFPKTSLKLEFKEQKSLISQVSFLKRVIWVFEKNLIFFEKWNTIFWTLFEHLHADGWISS